MKRLAICAALCAGASLLTIAVTLPARADDAGSPAAVKAGDGANVGRDIAYDDAAAREARWQDVEDTIFNGKRATPDPSIVGLEAPYRADDASLVPIAITLSGKAQVKELYLVIDDNPSPVAAHYTFGPAADPHLIRMRVRVNSYTNVHAVAKLANGRLVEAAKFVKAAGGCSAPMGMSDEEAMKGMGEMRMKFAQEATPGKPMEATLMVRHPNFNGMQMNQLTRFYTPARFIEKIKVEDGNKLVFAVATGISLSSNPVISFGLVPQSAAPITVAVRDNKDGHWEKSFSVPTATN